MANTHNCRHILQLATIYRRIFSVLVVNVDLDNIDKVNKEEGVNIKRIPTLLALLVVTVVAVLSLFLQLYLQNTLPLTENLALYSMVWSHHPTSAFPLIHSLFNYRQIHVFWCKVYETTCFAISELVHDVSLRYFWKRFFIDTAISVGTFILYGMCQLWIYSRRTSYERQLCTVLLQEIIIYIIVHALFIVNLSSFFNRLLIKYVNLDYRNRASSLTVENVEMSLLHQLRLYKQFHYKLWEMTTAVNAFFGLTLLVMSYHAFVDIAYSA